MRRPRVRFTILRMMVGVALVGTAIGLLAERRTRFLRTAAMHERSILVLPPYPTDILTPQANWYIEMKAKYERAARYPWLPVEPDPPEPK